MKGRYSMPNGDGSRRITRSEAKKNKNVKEEVNRRYENAIDEDTPPKKKQEGQYLMLLLRRLVVNKKLKLCYRVKYKV